MDMSKSVENQKNVPVESARKSSISTLATLALLLSFVAGVAFGELRAKPEAGRSAGGVAGTGELMGKDSPPPFDLKDVDFAQFWEVWKMVQDGHVDQDASDVEMFYGAVAGMVASLEDPYSVYFDPEFARMFASELDGSFEGIGAEIGVKKDQLTIVAPLPGTPAEKAGLKAGDRIYAIDDTDTAGMLVEDAVMRIRGEKGTEVRLLIGRDGLSEPKEIVIVRSTIVVEPVKYELINRDGRGYALITISQFNDATEAKFRAAVRAALLADPAGVIIDLRNDPGGYLDTAIAVAGEWITEGTVVIERMSDGEEKSYPSDGAARLADTPTVVLVNEGSASASEIVAGALQDTGKAVIVGEKTFGKGSVQDYVEFDDGSALKLTVAKWYTPSGRSIDKEGILPDVEVSMTAEDFEADRDPQLDKAIELLAAPGGLPTEIPKPDETAAGDGGETL